MENGEETFASPTAAAAEFEFDTAFTNGGGRAKPHDAADEIEALRAAKRDLEAKLEVIGQQNHFLSAESRRLEALVSKARDAAAAFEQAATTNESEAVSLRAEVDRLRALLTAEKAGHEEEVRKGAGLGDQLKAAYNEKVALEEEIEALKASGATAAAGKDREVEEPAAPVAPKEAGVAPPGLVAAAAAGAAATAAITVVMLNLKR